MSMIERVKLLDSDLQKCVFSGPLSRDTTYALYVSGPWRAQQIDNLIKLLQLQREWLTDDEQLGTGSEGAPGLAQCDTPSPALESSDGQPSENGNA